MSDIDLLVGRTEIAPSLEALRQLDYNPVEDVHGDYHDDHHHCAPLFRSGDYGTLEIHRNLMEPPYAAVLPMETVMAEVESLEVEGAHMRVLSPTHRILHNIVHSQLVDHHHDNGILPLRSLHETVTEQAAITDNVDWRDIEKQMLRQHRSHILLAYLYMAYKLFAMPFPAPTRPTLFSRLYYQRCRAQLRWRWTHKWGLRLGRYSPDTLNERYACGRGWLAVNRSRILQLTGKI